MNSFEKIQKIDLSAHIIGAAAAAPILVVSSFFLLKTVYTKVFKSIIGGLQSYVNYQEWRSVRNGVFSGWDLWPNIKGLCGWSNLNEKHIIGNCQEFSNAFYGNVLTFSNKNLEFSILLEHSIIIPSLLISFFMMLLFTAFLIVSKNIINSRIRFEIDNFRRFNKPSKNMLFINRNVVEFANEYIEMERNKAIASLTQMLAHDVRKPFSLLSAGMLLIESASSLEQIQKFLPNLRKSLNKSLISVNSMLSDIMHFGSENRIETASYSPKCLITDSLEEISHVYEGANIDLEFFWSHSHLASCDPEKMKRVVSNIIGNACQAMKGVGKLWVKTEEDDGMIYFTLRNSDSYIPPEERANVFEAFYTKGKKAGTGLGLAIAKKIVEDHSGKISVSSNVDQKTVEFTFTLPASQEIDSETKELPATLAGFLAFETKRDLPRPATNENSQIPAFLAKLERFVQDQGKRITVAILDDEEIYRSLIITLLKGPEISQLVDYKEFSNSKGLLESDLSKIDFLISDVDLEESIDGFELTKFLIKERKVDFPICIHSNKALAQDYELAVKAGATAFLPKPMTIDHLLKFLADGVVSSSKISGIKGR